MSNEKSSGEDLSEEKPVVLIVEDNPINQKVLKRQLEKRGFKVDIADNGLIGFKAASQRTYLAIFMDCEMPVLDGYSAAEKIRAEAEKNLKTPIIATTAYTSDESRRRCTEVGMNHFLAKPIRTDHLDDAIQQWVHDLKSAS